MTVRPNIDFVEGSCLVLISHGISHGYQLAKHFEAHSPIGEVLTLSRPVVYRAIKKLEAQHLIRSVEATGVRGQLKWQLKCTREGDRFAMRWIVDPVLHLRELRTEFLLKILLSTILKIDTTQLIHNQRQAIDKVGKSLLSDLSSKPVAIWRREQARAAMRFLDELEGTTSPKEASPNERPNQLLISARNQLQAQVRKVKHGDTLSTVYLDIDSDQTITSTITRDAALDLSLAPGSQVVALFKATEVMIATDLQRVRD